MTTQEYIRQAQVYLKQGKLSQAIDFCHQAIELQPFSPLAYTTLGEILEASGDPTAARDAFVQALEISPTFVLAHAYLGQLYSEYCWLDEAAFHYGKALELKPDWPELNYNLGNVFHNQGNLLGAIDCYRKAIAQKPDYLLAVFNLAVVLNENNQLEAAIDSYRQAIALQPDYVEAYSNLGVILLKEDRPAEAIEIYQRAIEIKPEWATPHNNLGQVFHEKSPEKAIASYRRAIELAPEMVLAHYNLGKAWQLQGEHLAAVACFDRVIELNPQHISGYTDAGFSLMFLGKIAEAMPYFQQAVALKPEFVEAYCRLGETRQVATVEDDELSRAIAACDRFLKALTGSKKEEGTRNKEQGKANKEEGRFITDAQFPIPDAQFPIPDAQFPIPDAQFPIPDAQLPIGEICDYLAEIYLHLGNALTEYGGYESAAAYYQKALQIQPKNAELYWRLGNCLAQQHRFGPAIVVYRMALKIQPALPHVYFELAKLLEKQGRLERAIDYYQQVLELQLHGYGDPKQWEKQTFISSESNYLERPRGIYLSSWDWLVNAKLDAGNYVEIVWESATEARVENIQTSKFSVNSQLANSDCAGLTCGLCLHRISKWFDPVHLGWGVCRLSNSQPIPVDSPKTFVAQIPNGRVWIVPQQNYWLICKAIAVMTPDNYLLADVSRDYPGLLPGCEKHDIRKHSVFKLESFPPLKQIDGSVAVLSGLSGNVYFHWMVDVLPRIELLRRSGRDLAEIDWFLVNSCQHEFQRESLRILGIPEEKVLESDRIPHLQATELIVPSFAGYLGWPSGWAIDFLRREFLKGIIPGSSYPKRIYISRSKARYRRVLNEEDVVEVLARSGFVSILPESMSLAEQIAHFYHAEVIVAAHGSGLTNTIFGKSGTKVIELVSPHYISHYYWGISQYLQLEHYFLAGEAFECYPIRQLMYQNSLTEDILVNLSSLKRMVEVVGLR
ncbi:MAG: tetratricopeptide repeat protein [Microcoleus sp. PH2017_25_DOB_D_A]|uniref:tetratricopeptide repeat protein n=1 Tax=unclassified Microcoleus TaxID=2642155 RepID=UPI001D6307F7|nr:MULTISPECIES: tetratricopeptide repeat protein [unclassified Microcoleus]TAE44912.1 MAG: tetratricopeptide repeat protein [Oscillatoriales cyanobacterium]MCC3533361.1 tetratricopeptide repeat protein [Microcoleus sp. PH2017_25_DOB_D_A]MCC3547519.1 tetratricopeptide repeat protein [Microcoleus sp. PH2017_24_DOB_U_A]MCC3564138.1 tetratricopeptide repeat protein [Microcoleus sp. PH2017_31_RDM_U_A]MCC3576696.1 tetratricopeptide repeat protein [Microcoleus sp. PH2017_32_RDM_D_A]